MGRTYSGKVVQHRSFLDICHLKGGEIRRTKVHGCSSMKNTRTVLTVSVHGLVQLDAIRDYSTYFSVGVQFAVIDGYPIDASSSGDQIRSKVRMGGNSCPDVLDEHIVTCSEMGSRNSRHIAFHPLILLRITNTRH
jgi:hypothetical protein